jgi:hypothetical protein
LDGCPPESSLLFPAFTPYLEVDSDSCTKA